MVTVVVKRIIVAYRLYIAYLGLRKLKRVKLNGIRAKYGLRKVESFWEYSGISPLIQFIIYKPIKFIFKYFFTYLSTLFSCDTNHPLFQHGTKANKIFKWSIGFFGGSVLSLLTYFFIYYQIEEHQFISIIISLIIAILFSISLAVSHVIQCIILLMLPTLFASKGRTLLVAYVFVLVATGPMPNIGRNTKNMIKSITCGQNMASEGGKSVTDHFKNMLEKIHVWFEEVTRPIKLMAKSMEEFYNQIGDTLDAIGDELKPVAQFFSKLTDICEERIKMTPEKCKESIENALTHCTERNEFYIPSISFAQCESFIRKFKSNNCRELSLREKVCNSIKEKAENIKRKVTEKWEKFVNHLYNEIYFNVDADYRFDYNLSRSKEYGTAFREITRDFSEKFSYFTIFSYLINNKMILLIFTIWILINAIIYRERFLRFDGFDNFYINDHFVAIDKHRSENNKETLIPINIRERRKYIDPYDLQMISYEKRNLYIGLFIFSIGAVHATFYLTIDYMLYESLWGVSQLLDKIIAFPIPAHIDMNVKGEGMLSDIQNKIADANKVGTSTMTLMQKLVYCRPNPNVPDFDIYQKIGIFLLMALISVFTEAYGLRIRHIVAGFYYPNRVRPRAVWLYNTILCQRGDFLKFARRQLRKKVLGDDTMEQVSLLDSLCTRYKCLRTLLQLFGYYEAHKNCLICGKRGKNNDVENFKFCQNQGCHGVYCCECFADINNMCTLCMRPIDYGDADDMSEERDSSDEDIRYEIDESKDFDYQYMSTEDDETSDSENETADTLRFRKLKRDDFESVY